MLQKTIKNNIGFSGVGLHTGCDVHVRIIPSGEDTGITFIRTDIKGAPAIKAEASNVIATSYATSLGTREASISTVEHLLAAFNGLGVDNATVELDGPEVPILDGSAKEFIKMIDAVGLTELCSPRKYILVKRPIKVQEGGKYIFLMPSEDMEFTVDYTIDFAHPFMTRQNFSRLFSKDVFRNEVGGARTFGFLRDVEMLRKNGLAKGGSLNNAVVIGDDEILNKGGLRHPDEFVRHKVLDMMGDISLLGAPVVGRIIAHRSGHSLNYKLVQQILKMPGRWELIDSWSGTGVANTGMDIMEKVATV